MTVPRLLVNVRRDQLKKEFRRDFCGTILMGTRQASSPLSVLVEAPNALKSIFEYAVPTPNMDEFDYRAGLVMCNGTEHVSLEALKVDKGKKRCGSLYHLTMSCRLALDFFLEKFLPKYAWKKNKDGSYLDEGQLRVHWKKELHCTVPRCRGLCAALPGDTVYWKPNEWGYRESYMYTCATNEDLIERGFITDEWEGMLAHEAKFFREGEAKKSSKRKGDEVKKSEA